MAKEQELSVQVYDLVQSMKKHWEPITFFKTLLKICKRSEIKISDLPVKPYSMASIHQGFQRKFYGLYNQ